MVKECVPGASFLTRIGTVHIAYVIRPEEALALPWIEKLPGEKRIRFVHGQIFVMQHYLGCRLVRAHICRDEERCATPFGQHQMRY
jgi:hypothetical protein